MDTVIAANPTFLTGKAHQLIWGQQHRSIWATPARVSQFYLDRVAGGLTPIKQGGGMSSNTLRMEDSLGREYVLRSVNKDYSKLIPAEWADLKLLNILQDQNSASHPFGALMVPALSRAAGVYHTLPKIVFLPPQQALDTFKSTFRPALYLFEERPDGDASDNPAFGRATRIIGHEKLMERLRESPNHVVDQRWVCKSRLLDILIHDWDRHDDQWRWSAFETREKTIYRPVPRDRDQAFFRFEGWIPSYLSAFIVKKLKTMRPRIRDVEHHAFNARHFDRFFMNELTWTDWAQEIEAFQQNITDPVLLESIAALPDEVSRSEQARTVALLRARRDDMLRAGYQLYRFLSREVEVTGTDNDDVFEIETLTNGSLRVRVSTRRDNATSIQRYERLFLKHETREVRLYGLGGQDVFRFIGDLPTHIRVRVIGGDGADVVSNDTPSKIYVYDTPAGIATRGDHLVDRTDTDTLTNTYHREAFQYNTRSVLLRTGYTRDDQWWGGAGATWVHHAWRKQPYQSKHQLKLAVAPTQYATAQVDYRGHWPNIVGRWAVSSSTMVAMPRHENYFGIGNETANPLREWSYHWVPIHSAVTTLHLQRASQDGAWQIKVGPAAETHTIQARANRVTSDPVLGFAVGDGQPRHFVGVDAQGQVDFLDSELFPTRGIRGQTSLRSLWELPSGGRITQLDVAMQGYLPILSEQRLVLATQAGMRRVWGPAPFYQLPALGNTSGLRGFRNQRFRGDWALFQNVDARVKLLTWRNVYLPMHIGLVLGCDVGRVGVAHESSNTWHNSQTVGLWFNLLDMIVVHPMYVFNREQNLVGFRVGFGF